MSLTHWKFSLRQTFRILPRVSPHLTTFLESDGSTQAEVLGRLTYEANRAIEGTGAPNPKRYRDPRFLYESIGLLFEGADGRVHLTDFGKTTWEWLPIITDRNSWLLCRHAAYALAAVQLRNPTPPGREYSHEMEVFPLTFIWRAMLALENRINSDELNRVILRTRNPADLALGIEVIRRARNSGRVEDMGDELIVEVAKNDRLIPWMAQASFGWTLIADKDESGFYQIKDRAVELVRQATMIPHRHRTFRSTQEYVEFLSDCASLPPDLR